MGMDLMRSAAQKIVGVGLVGGLVGGLIYWVSGRRHAAPPPNELPPEPVERDPSAPSRGHYR